MPRSSAQIPAPRTQAQRREQTRAALITATIRSIAEHGYLATTTRRVIEMADSSPGALAYHFPSRLDLIAATLDEVGRLAVDELRARVADLPATGDTRTAEALEVMWDYFTSELFQVWIRVWFAASEDAELYERLAPLERTMNAGITAAATDLIPPDLPRPVWNRRIGVALDTMRGLALRLSIEPRQRPRKPDPWPATRAELSHLLDRRSGQG